MPHKHKRQRRDGGTSFDLPPTHVARPLPAFHKINREDEPERKAGKSQRTGDGISTNKAIDDTPRAFARLLEFQRTGRRPARALDDGSVQKGKKRKHEAGQFIDGTSKPKDGPTVTPGTATSNLPDMKILPGERLAEFSARVDQALPIAGLRTKGQTSSVKMIGAKGEERKTKHNRRLERMQKAWREEESRRKEKLEEVMEHEEEKREEQQVLWDGVRSGARKNRKRKGKIGAIDEGEDPWAELEERRRDSRQKNLQDVVQAPPELKGVKGGLKDHGLAGADVRNVPGSVGSLRKREEMGLARKNVIDQYRKTMAERNQVVVV